MKGFGANEKKIIEVTLLPRPVFARVYNVLGRFSHPSTTSNVSK
jgi:hypothetical protein